MAFLFSKHRRRSSVDQQDPYTARRKASVDALAEERIEESTGQPTSAASKIAALKSKLTSRSILNLSTKHDDDSPTSPTSRRFSASGQGSPNSPTAAIGKGGRRSSLATSSIPQVPPTSSERLANITGPSSAYPPGTTVMDEPLIPTNENAARRLSQTASSNNREVLNAVWKPIDPERRPLASAAPQPVPLRPSAPSGGNSDSSTTTIPMTPVSPNQPSAYSIRSPPTRPEIGKISIPPPHLPSRLASNNHFRESPSTTSSPGGWARTPGPGSARTPGGTGWGMTIIPSTPLPRPIANLPTLNPANGSAPGSHAGSRPTSSHGYAAGYGFPVMANGAGSDHAGPSRGGSAATSPVRGVEASPAEIRRAKQRMPVMLREPSHRPPPAQEAQEESDSDSASDESSSESGSGDNSSDAETETEESAPRRQRAFSASAVARDRTGSGASEASTSSVSSDDTAQAGITSSLATAGARSLLHNRPRQSSAPHHSAHAHQISVASITEENEDDGATGVDFGNYNMGSSPMQSSSNAARTSSEATNGTTRPGDRPRLSLPSHSSMEPSSNNSTTWSLATPGTPTSGALSLPTPEMDASSSWTSFGASTPTGIAPGLSAGFLQSQPRKSALSRSNTASGEEAEAGASPEVVQTEKRPQAGPSANHDSGYFGSTIPDVAQISSPGAASTGTIAEGSTPTQEDISGRRVSEESSGSLAPPLVSLNLGPAVDATSRPLNVLETLSETPAPPPAQESPLHVAVIEHATVADEPVLVNIIPEPTQPKRPTGLRVTRPSLNKNASRSMVNLSLTAREQAEDARPLVPISASMDRTESAASTVSGRPLSGVLTPASARSSVDWTRPPPTPGIGMTQPFKFSAVPEPMQSPKQMVQNRQLQALGPSPLKRRRSMDDMHVKLPDYAPPAKGVYLPRPREEEGREKLPEYFCHVHIEGYLPRKMEFTSPGVQARDRSWKRHYFVIHGTALSVYKHDIHKVPLKSGDPHGVPEVDEADYDNLHVHRAGDLRRGSLASTSAAAAAEKRNSPVPQSNSPDASRRGSVDASGTGSTREGLVAAAAARRASQSAGTSISTSSSNGPDSKDLALFTNPSNSSTTSGARRGSVSSSQLVQGSSGAASHGVHLPFHGNNVLIKQYTLQNAESGLAADYTKKRNVVRVRVEGEQFLLQTESAKDVVDWIEAFQAATNVALDLDERPMPKIITLPRRRRRRRPGEPAPNAQATGVPNTEDTPEGNARAVAEAERQAAAAREQNIDDMERMLAEDQAA